MNRLLKGELSSKTVRAAVKFGQKGHWPVVGQLVDLVHGWGSEAYRRVPFYEVDKVTNTQLLLEAEGDSSASAVAERIFRLRKQALVLSAGRLSLEDFLNHTQGELAVAAGIGETMLAGILPELGLNLRKAPLDQPFEVGLRHGRDEFSVGLGAFIREGNIFIPTPDVGMPEQHIPKKKFHITHPYADLV